MMKTLGILLISLALATAADPAWRKSEKLAVEGVSLGTRLPAVRKALGKPVREVDEPDDHGMGLGPGKTFEYPGLTVELGKPEGEPDFHVWRMVLSGGEWQMTPGLKIGMTRDEAVALLGAPDETSRGPKEGVDRLHYSFRTSEGWLWLDLRDGRVVKIGVAEDWS